MERTIIPATTIARIFQEVAFKNEDTRITLSTLDKVSEYTRLFVNEAVLRSNEARIQEGDTLNKVDGIDNIDKKSDDIEDDFDENNQIDPVDAYNLRTNADHYSNDTLDSRHLASVAGVLVLDF